MTEEELEKEAEEKAKKRTKGFACQDNCEKSYVMGALDFAESREKRIAGLEQQLSAMEKGTCDVCKVKDAEFYEKRIEELEKENAELKADNDARKFAMAMSEKVEKQLRKENAELKEKLKPENCLKSLAKSGLVKFTCENGNEHDQLTKAKIALRKVVDYLGQFCSDYPDCVIEAEQFLKGESTAEQPNECHACAKFDEMPKGPRCKTCDNGSHFQKKEEA